MLRISSLEQSGFFQLGQTYFALQPVTLKQLDSFNLILADEIDTDEAGCGMIRAPLVNI